MKKILSLVLTVVMIMAMAIPTFAATEDEVAPCAVCNGSHTKGTYQGYNTAYKKDGDTCLFITYYHYQCSVCHTLFSIPDTDKQEHNKVENTASCNGTTRTWSYKCTKCKGLFVTSSACPGAGHIAGNCSWLPF